MSSEFKDTCIPVPEVAETWGKEGFSSLLLEALSKRCWQLPFAAVCTTGAPSTDEAAECSDLKVELAEPHSLRGSFSYAFTEETNLGCSDQRYTDRVRGRFCFTYDLRTGLLRVEIPQIQAEYDPEEI